MIDDVVDEAFIMKIQNISKAIRSMTEAEHVLLAKILLKPKEYQPLIDEANKITRSRMGGTLYEKK